MLCPEKQLQVSPDPYIARIRFTFDTFMVALFTRLCFVRFSLLCNLSAGKIISRVTQNALLGQTPRTLDHCRFFLSYFCFLSFSPFLFSVQSGRSSGLSVGFCAHSEHSYRPIVSYGIASHALCRVGPKRYSD